MRAAAVATAILIAISLLPAIESLPTPGQDDAGSGTDAPDYRHVPPLPIGPGTYQGNLSSVTDDLDHYILDPPPKTVVRLRVSTPELVSGICTTVGLEMRTKHGETSRSCFVPDETGAGSLSLTSGQGEPVTLVFDTFTGLDLLKDITYNFSVTFETHDHVRAIHGGHAHVGAWSFHLPEGQWGRVEAYPPSKVDDLRFEDDLYLTRVLYSSPSRCVGSYGWSGFGGSWFAPEAIGGRSGTNGNDVAWVHGVAGDHGVGTPVDRDVAYPLTDEWTFRVETDEEPVSVHWGHAWESGPLGVLGWVLWDGPEDPVIENRTARAAWLTLQDFDESGTSFQVGPYAEAWNVSTHLRLDGDEPGTDIVIVDATTPAVEPLVGETGRRETVMEVTPPGEQTITLEDRFAAWATPGERPLADDAPPAGEWAFRIRQLSGTESDHIRVAMVEWDIPADCE